MRILLSFILFIQSFSIFGQESRNSNKDDIQIIQNFIKDLSNDSIRTDVIMSQHLIIENPNDELYDYLEVSLDEIRINLMSKKINDIKYIPYTQMARKDIRDIDLEDLNSNRIYFLHYKNRQLLAVYLEQNKVASFTLVAKGNNKAHFVLY